MPSARSLLATGLPQLVLLGLVWGATFPIAHVGVAAGADPFLLVTLDLLVATAVMAMAAAGTRTERPPVRSMLQSVGLGALLIGGINLPLYWGLQHATGGTAAIVYATAPLLSLVALRVLGSGQEIRRRELTALGIGLGGVILLGLATAGVSLAAGLLAVLAFGLGAGCQGVGAVLVGRTRPHGENHWGLTFQFAGGGLAALIVLGVVSPTLSLPLTGATLGSIAYVGLGSMAIGYTLFFSLIQRSGAVRANQVTFLNPVVALLVGVVAFGEGFEPLEAVALALIVIALLLLQPTRLTIPSRRPGAPRGPPSEAPQSPA